MNYTKPSVASCALKGAKYALDIGDGSERGPYVAQSYMLSRLQRPHRAVNLMFCYYPFDKEWPARISEVSPPVTPGVAWPYAYDDYFPFDGDEPLRQIRDVRSHGQDAILTLTCDPAVTDEMIIAIAHKLRPFGRLMLRLNHEATGNWFSFNKRCTYQQVADFFVRFKGIFAKEAPNIRIILCIGGIENLSEEKMTREEEFTKAVQVADIWSIDQYPSLNWGWPFEIAQDDTHSHKCGDYRTIFEMARRSFERYTYLNGGVSRPMQLCEYNEDGDVTGPYRQAERVKAFYDLIEKEGGDWFSGITMYQFRDDGRLGLETTDPADPNTGIEQPLMSVYREILSRPCFKPNITLTGQQTLPAILRWGGSEDAQGIAMTVQLASRPTFLELYFEETERDANLMIEVNGRWFCKAPGKTYVDLITAFAPDEQISGPLSIHLFAPPVNGTNVQDGHADWDINSYYQLKALPNIRLRYTPVLDN